VEPRDQGPVVAILHQYAYYCQGKTIHSSTQIEQYGNHVDDHAPLLGGKLRIVTLEGYVIPLSMHDGLPYLSMRPPNDSELKSLPHVVFTADDEWDPAVLDLIPDPLALKTMQEDYSDTPIAVSYNELRFDTGGLYTDRVIAHLAVLNDSSPRQVATKLEFHSLSLVPPQSAWAKKRA
jgi:hypothetical protein